MDFAALSYQQINQQIRNQGRGKTWGQNPLHEVVSSHSATLLDEMLFVDRVARNLRDGRFLLIILGDGIREDMAVLANYLMHHSLRYAFGMIQIKLFRLPDGSLMALPEVLVKTQTVERHVTVVTIAGEATVQGETGVAVVGEMVERTSISLDKFYRTMAHVDPRDVVWLKDLLSKLADLPIETELGAKGASLMLKASLPCGERIQFMIITATSGATHVGFWGIPYKAWSNPAWQRLSYAYLEQIVALGSRLNQSTR